MRTVLDDLAKIKCGKNISRGETLFRFSALKLSSEGRRQHRGLKGRRSGGNQAAGKGANLVHIAKHTGQAAGQVGAFQEAVPKQTACLLITEDHSTWPRAVMGMPNVLIPCTKWLPCDLEVSRCGFQFLICYLVTKTVRSKSPHLSCLHLLIQVSPTPLSHFGTERGKSCRRAVQMAKGHRGRCLNSVGPGATAGGERSRGSGWAG